LRHSFTAKFTKRISIVSKAVSTTPSIRELTTKVEVVEVGVGPVQGQGQGQGQGRGRGRGRGRHDRNG